MGGVTKAVTIIVTTRAENVLCVSIDADRHTCAQTSATSPLGIMPTPTIALLIPFFHTEKPLINLPTMAIGMRMALKTKESFMPISMRFDRTLSHIPSPFSGR